MEAVLFDWDGTLVDSLPALFQANVAVMAAFGLPFDETAYRHHYAPDWRAMYLDLGVPADRLDEANDRWLAAYEQGSASRLFDGVPEALERLARDGRRLGIVTAGHRSVVEPQLATLGLGGVFDIVVYGDDLPVHKPDPAPLRRALDVLGLAGRPAAAAYVGDVPDDMRMARAVGTRGIGIVSLLSGERELLAAGASEVASTVAEWVDRALGIMRIDRTPLSPAI
ncbi:MAG TPA: HAD family hydrolase [Candidatus Binatia bacterium]|nr:HAD family hydrolase [Candidatus Binatia bacterium]